MPENKHFFVRFECKRDSTIFYAVPVEEEPSQEVIDAAKDRVYYCAGIKRYCPIDCTMRELANQIRTS